MKPETNNKRTYPQRVKEAREKYLVGIDHYKTISITEIVTATVEIKEAVDFYTKKLEAFKSFFKEIGVPGEQFDGKLGTINLVGRATSAIDPVDLKQLLDSLGRTAEFMGMVSVKIADTRTKLGTVLFDKIADVVPNASITVKIGTK